MNHILNPIRTILAYLLVVFLLLPLSFVFLVAPFHVIDGIGFHVGKFIDWVAPAN